MLPQASVVGRLHEQLDHAMAKESLARNALNRSELSRIELEKEVGAQRGHLEETSLVSIACPRSLLSVQR